MPHQTTPIETSENPLDKNPKAPSRWLSALLGLLVVAGLVAAMMGLL